MICIKSRRYTMRLLFLLSLVLMGCPKSNLPDRADEERKKALEELMFEEDAFDDVPESRHESSDDEELEDNASD